jgi:uncharacterized membrane-anchored protein YhcB (DUF1043 family)
VNTLSLGDPWFYIVLIGVAAIIYSLLLPVRQVTGGAKRNHNATVELETTLEQYMAEIEKENAELIDLVSGMKQDFTAKQMALQEQVTELRGRIVDTEHSAQERLVRIEKLEANAVSHSAVVHIPRNETAYVDVPVEIEVASTQEDTIDELPVQEEVADSLHDRYAELFNLYDNGKSIDMIAKVMDMQRGEVQLILQLGKREESR